MATKKLRPKPVEISAIKWDGTASCFNNIKKFIVPATSLDYESNSDSEIVKIQIYNHLENKWSEVPVGYWILMGVSGEFRTFSESELFKRYEIEGSMKKFIDFAKEKSSIDTNYFITDVLNEAVDTGLILGFRHIEELEMNDPTNEIGKHCVYLIEGEYICFDVRTLESGETRLNDVFQVTPEKITTTLWVRDS